MISAFLLTFYFSFSSTSFAKHRIPKWSDQFRMDVLVATSTDPKQLDINGYGTVYYDALLNRSASFIHWGSTDKRVVLKQVALNETVFTVDLATGDCHRRSVDHRLLSIHKPLFLKEAIYQGDGYVRRGRRWFHVQLWQKRLHYAMPFGDVAVRVDYQHTLDLDPFNVPMRVVYRDRFCPFKFKQNKSIQDPCYGGYGLQRIVAVDYSRWRMTLDDVDKDYIFDVPAVCPKGKQQERRENEEWGL